MLGTPAYNEVLREIPASSNGKSLTLIDKLSRTPMLGTPAYNEVLRKMPASSNSKSLSLIDNSAEPKTNSTRD
jgi:hypothetical protein